MPSGDLSTLDTVGPENDVDDEPTPRPSLLRRKDTRAPAPDKLQVDPADRPGWVSAATVDIRVGDNVYCTAGTGSVVRILGRTGNGTRLLEVKLDSGVRDSFFSPASNLLTPPPAK